MSSRTPGPDATAAFSMDAGDIRGWCDSGVAMVRCVTAHGDAVEMNGDELRAFIEQLRAVESTVADDEGQAEPPPDAGTGPSTDVARATAVLIETWCAQRELNLLSKVLPAFLALNGLTDGWAELRAAVRSALATECSPSDELRLRDIERGIDRLLRGGG